MFRAARKAVAIKDIPDEIISTIFTFLGLVSAFGKSAVGRISRRFLDLRRNHNWTSLHLTSAGMSVYRSVQEGAWFKTLQKWTRIARRGLQVRTLTVDAGGFPLHGTVFVFWVCPMRSLLALRG